MPDTNNDFKVLLEAVLDTSNIGKKDIDKINKVLDKYKIDLKIEVEDTKLITNIRSILSKVQKELNKNGVELNIEDISDKQLLTYLSQVRKEADKTSKVLSNIKFNIDNGKGVSAYQNQIDKYISEFQRYGLSIDEAKNKVLELQNILNTLKPVNTLSDDQILTQADKFQKEVQSVKVALDQAKISYDKFAQPQTQEKISGLINRINEFITKNTAITEEARQQLQAYVNTLNQGVNIQQYNDINASFGNIQNNMRSLGKLGKSFSDQMKDAAASFTQWFSISSAIMTMVYQLQKIPREVYEVDTAMTGLYKVTDETEDKYVEFLDNAHDRAQKLGRSISSLTDQTAEWAKLG